MEILAGRLKPGTKLPSVRDFALQFQANPNTIQRALAELERENLIFTERTNGKYITEDFSLITRAREAYAAELTAIYKTKMQEIGFLKEENA